MANINKVCIVGASGKLGQYMVQQSLDHGYEVVGVCREKSVDKLDPFMGKITTPITNPEAKLSSMIRSPCWNRCSFK